MAKSAIERLLRSGHISAGNAAYAEGLYEQYLSNPADIPDEWRTWFDTLSPVPGNDAPDRPHSGIREDLRLLAKNSGLAQPKAANASAKDSGLAQPRVANARAKDSGLAQPRVANARAKDSGLAQPRVANARAKDSGLAQPRVANARAKDSGLAQPKDANASRGKKQWAVGELINGYRRSGHLRAKLDPLKLQPVVGLHLLKPGFYELYPEDFKTRFQINPLVYNSVEASLEDIIELMDATYCASVGAEYMHISVEREQDWVRDRMEEAHSLPEFDHPFKKRLLSKLIAAEGLEKYLAARYPGAKRFGLEGGESFIPCLAELIHCAGSKGVLETVIGMAHRGRINVLVNLMGKKPAELFDEFEGRNVLVNLMGKKPAELFDEFEGRYIPGFGSGDVKYHQGFSSSLKTPDGEMHLALGFNPSHLEISAPVIEGSVRARMDRRHDVTGSKVLAIYVHGDAAIAGQGVVMETFQMSQTRGFSTGGTIHVVINNQIGYTVSKRDDARSTHHCTEVAKMVQAPIFHVNGDDPEAVLFVTQMAFDYWEQFKKDVVIDIVCYRRRGHNEGDEPSVTQPEMYQKISKHPTTLALYAEKLIAEGVLDQDEYDARIEKYRNLLDKGEPVAWDKVQEPNKAMHVDWSEYLGHKWDISAKTGVKPKRFQALAEELSTLPEGFKLQKQVARILEDRDQMSAGTLAVNWGYGEIMAYATLLDEGFKIRLTGQDVGRGTFAHRHAVLHDQAGSGDYTPLKVLADKRALDPQDKPFMLYDSFLSEEAVLAFEYGYSQTSPDTLVIWEAQFGDFANGAQVVIDQFITSGEHKWSRLSGLTMLLPHGYEGAGPEHSSARLERYLQLCAEHNIQVCIPSTPAQMFHLIRRQARRPLRKPLIVMTPKSLLRHKQAVSSLDELCNGEFKTLVPDPADLDKTKVERIVFCSGKVYYDLDAQREKSKLTHVALVRLEQLYPFPKEDMKAVLETYHPNPSLRKAVWCQEEPRNQGAWYSSQHHLREELQAVFPKIELDYAGRDASAAAAVGYLSLHQKQQKQLVVDALGESGAGGAGQAHSASVDDRKKKTPEAKPVKSSVRRIAS